MCTKGIAPIFDYAQLAIKKYGIIIKSGAWFTLCNPDTGEIYELEGKPVKLNGLAKVYQFLEDHTDYYQSIKSYIMKDLNSNNEILEV